MKSGVSKIRWFRKQLLKWYYKDNQRKFPWRETNDPYKILVSEIMLRRTRADQVQPVYTSFTKKYPTLSTLAKANPKHVKTEMKSLGLEWRADNLLSLVMETQSAYNSSVPIERDDLLSLTGVGQYVAAAVRCFAHGIPEPLIDTNIVRVIGRFFGLNLKGEARRRKEMIETVESCVPIKNSKNYHYAILDFAAGVCVARKPRCDICPLTVHCCYAADANS